MAGFLDNVRWPECECIDWGERRNTVASIVSGVLVSRSEWSVFRLCCPGPTFPRLVGYQKESSPSKIIRLPHLWGLLYTGFLHLEHPHTVPADGAVGVEGHQAFWTCGNKPSILVLPVYKINAVSNAHIHGDTYGEGCLGRTGARLWLFIGFMMMFGSLIAAIWILFGAYVVPGNPVYPGLSVFFQNVLIFFSGSRAQSDLLTITSVEVWSLALMKGWE
ncbi:hypothetical protein NFI96_012379 [Prochilodus magdalenae]|nr:hypothetical protein NFI96_012379 [Prochilodus magdalenae]